ncbi:MAG: nucleotidyltransferase family protein [Armatimonadota bacterium]|nr:nucleotidyltransferase family protein [Armatimonadota bacterium]
MEHQDSIGPFSAIISAAGQAGEDLARVLGVDEKCAAMVGEQPLALAATIAALSAGASQVAIVCGPKTRAMLTPLPTRCVFAEPGTNPVESARAGARSLNPTGTILFLPGDLPFVGAEHVSEFLSELQKRIPDRPWVAAGISSRVDIERRFPNAPGMGYMKLDGVQYAGGGIFAASPEGFERTLSILSKIAGNRKSQMRMALRFGPMNVIRYFTGRMTTAGAEHAGQRLFGCDSFVIPNCAPETTIDVDNAEDWTFALNHLAS